MKGKRSNIIDWLLASDEPAVRYLTRVRLLGEDPRSRAANRDRAMIPRSPLMRALFSHVDASTYRKWTGPHWILAFCSELGYPPGEKKLRPLADRCAKWALGINGTLIDGHWRRCASQQGYAILYLMKLGFRDARCDELVARLLKWQWPRGGWNCDKRPAASHASFHESLLPMRALFHYANETGNDEARRGAMKAAKMFLDRKLFRRKTDGEVIDPRFLVLHYPYHWRYNILHGLKAMAEAGLLRDRRCREPLVALKKMQLDGGGLASSPTRPYKRAVNATGPHTPADFGPYGARRVNPFVTIDALYVLRQASGDASVAATPAARGRGSGG